MPLSLVIIAALDNNRVIGHKGKLPWHLPDDLKRFKATTMGHHLIVGHATFQSLGSRALPGRKMVVLSRQKKLPPPSDGVMWVPSLTDALTEIERLHATVAYVIGGAMVYALAFPFADKMELTRINHSYQGDTHFPPYQETDWELLAQYPHPRQGTQPEYTYEIYQHKKNNKI